MAEGSSPPPIPSEQDLKDIRAVKDEDLPWLPPRPDPNGSKFISKMKENPFVPIGM